MTFKKPTKCTYNYKRKILLFCIIREKSYNYLAIMINKHPDLNQSCFKSNSTI